MKAFFKDNFVLFAGISLPLLLTLIFFMATQIDKAHIDPPRYSVVFATDYNPTYSHYPYRILLENNVIRFRYYPPGEKDTFRHYHKPRLFIFNPLTNNTREIELPNIDDPQSKMDQPVKGITFKTLSSLKDSPDGFVFEYASRRNSNLMTEIFGGGYRSHSHHVLRKGSYKLAIPKSERYNSQFIAWIIDPGEGLHVQ